MLSNLQASHLWVLEKHIIKILGDELNEKKNPDKRHAYDSSRLRICAMGGYSGTR